MGNSTDPFEFLEAIPSEGLFEQKLRDRLDSTPLLSDLDWPSIKLLAKYMRAYRAKKGTVLFHEGDEGRFLCLLLEGRVDIQKEDFHHKQKIVSSIGRGKILGEMSIIDDELRSATAVVTEPALLAILTRENFDLIAKEHPHLGIRILWKLARMLSQRLRHTSGILVEFLSS